MEQWGGCVMNLVAVIDRMGCFPATVRAACAGLSVADERWRPDATRWSIVEIVTHLADEEGEDFRARVRSTLKDPTRAWMPIDPEGWADERRYRERDLGEELSRFERERADSVAWLRSLRDPDWSRAYEHPKLGPIAAGDLMASWCAHDALHLRQIAKRLYELTRRDAAGFGTAYAGEWGA